MTLDADVKAYLAEFVAPDWAGWESLTPAEARRLYAGQSTLRGTGCALESVKDHTTDGGVPVRVYRPVPETPLPAIVYFHGGGWIVGDLETHDALCRNLADQARTVVVAVDYRLSPEARFPGPLEDCYSALKWVADQAQTLGIDKSRIAVSGDSAGGNLAAGVCLLARDRYEPSIRFQLLFYPVMWPNFETASYQLFADGYGLTRQDMRWFWSQYLGDAPGPLSPYAAPLAAEDLAGLPPALVVTAEYDVLRDEGELFARRLTESGVPSQWRRYDGVIHGFVQLASVIARGREALANATAVTRAALVEDIVFSHHHGRAI